MQIKSMKGLMAIALCFLYFSSFNFSNRAQAAESDIYSEQFQLEQSTARYYVTTLDEDDSWVLNCTAVFEGVFYLFIFDERPTSDYFDEDGSLNSEITDVAVAYNNTPSEIFSESLNDTISAVSLEFKASESKMYYLEIACVDGGPDTFMLNSSAEIQPYFIPFIPGFPVGITIVFSGMTICVLIFIQKRKRKN